ncbi:hypothetical protein AGOR_G00042510 [Albula goreensis]|uniref:Uncharacterized protein n=1 Tax=Albula goreensis TaxID=1534307 RepID=A0A8T3E2K5_9TELE|nr:hypothetical protein AGOR_G00042510 [Albula goreensis]
MNEEHIGSPFGWIRYFLFAVWVFDIICIYLITYIKIDTENIKDRMERAERVKLAQGRENDLELYENIEVKV